MLSREPKGLFKDGLFVSELLDVARTIYGEARGESYEGKKAVAHVIINRALFYSLDKGKGLSAACKRPWQFSCWNKKDPNRVMIENVTLADPKFRICLAAAVEALISHDTTYGATHYHSRSVEPIWAQGEMPSFHLGRHVFYNNIS